jgi:hypothetical protein
MGHFQRGELLNQKSILKKLKFLRRVINYVKKSFFFKGGKLLLILRNFFKNHPISWGN